MHKRITPSGLAERDIDEETEWWDLVIDGYGLDYRDVARAERRAVWRRVRGRHDEWIATGRG